MIAQFVLDAWAVIALLQAEEPAATRVRDLLDMAAAGQTRLFLSIINLGEIYYSVGRLTSQTEADETAELIRDLPLTIASATDDLVFLAAGLKIHRRISYADAFAAALAINLEATLVTGDPELIQMGDMLRVEPLTRVTSDRTPRNRAETRE